MNWFVKPRGILWFCAAAREIFSDGSLSGPHFVGVVVFVSQGFPFFLYLLRIVRAGLAPLDCFRALFYDGEYFFSMVSSTVDQGTCFLYSKWLLYVSVLYNFFVKSRIVVLMVQG